MGGLIILEIIIGVIEVEAFLLIKNSADKALASIVNEDVDVNLTKMVHTTEKPTLDGRCQNFGNCVKPRI